MVAGVLVVIVIVLVLLCLFVGLALFCLFVLTLSLSVPFKHLHIMQSIKGQPDTSWLLVSVEQKIILYSETCTDLYFKKITIHLFVVTY